MKKWVILVLVLLLSGCVKSSETCISNEPSTLEEYKNQIENWELKGNKADCKIYPLNNNLECRFGIFGKLAVVSVNSEQLEGSCETGYNYEPGWPGMKIIHKKTIRSQKIFETTDKNDDHEGWTWCSKDEKFVIGVEVDNGQIQKYFDEFYEC